VPASSDSQQQVYKEAATKVVELQRQVMVLNAKLRNKGEVEHENARLKQELNDYKQKFFESQKKHSMQADAGRD
jgi:hypothetical protein